MRLALFDLDHTLIDFDSGMAWTRFLVARGVLPAAAEAVYLQHCHDYVAGTLDIRAMHRASVAPLAGFDTAEIAGWAAAYGRAMRPRLRADMQALVHGHRAAGDLCAIVTATSRFVAEPFAVAFGITHLLATEPAQVAGRYNGEIIGEPCFREQKIVHVERWLHELGHRLCDFAQTCFYSDSASDLPLLTAVTRPVAVRPDARLRSHASACGWTILD